MKTKSLLALCLMTLCAPLSVRAQYSASQSGSAVAAAEINSKPAIQIGSGAPSGNCTAGKDFYVDGIGYVLYYCKSTNVWAAVQPSLGFTPANIANNLSDLANEATARSNLGLGSAATLNVGTAANNVVELNGSGQLPAVSGALLTNLPGLGFTPANIANNLSDLANEATARTNLGLGSAATLNVGTAANNVVELNGSGQLPAVSGALLTNLPGSGVSSFDSRTGAVVPTSGDYSFSMISGSASSGQIPTLNQNTTGNAGTATALAATPSLCSSGQAPTGVLANGNATGCQSVSAGGSMVYPSAGVANSTGSAWGTSYAVGALANDLVQLNGSAQLPAVSAALLTNFPALNQSTTGNAATATALAATPSLCTSGQAPTGVLANGNATGCQSVSGGSMVYPSAGVANSTGSAWGTSYAVGASANDLVQLNASTQLPAVSAALLTNFPTFNQSTTGNAATATALAATPSLCTGGQVPTGVLANGNATGCATISGSGTSVQYTLFRSINQNTIAGSNFSIPALNAPTAVSTEGASSGDVTTLSSAWNFGTLSFAANSTANTANSVQGTINLPSTWSSSAGITLQITWRTSATTGNALWQIQGQCIASGAVPGSFSAGVAMTASPAPTTTLEWKPTAVTTLTTSNALSGCSAGNIFLFRLYRDHQNASDTIAATEELIQASFGVTQ